MALKVLNPINNLDLSRLTQVAGIELSDLLLFADLSATAPKSKQLTVQQFLDAVLPTLTGSITPTGVVMDFAGLVAPTGWLLCSGLSIGSATSGSTARANVDTLNLFTLLWTAYSNTTLPIQTSAGAPSTRGSGALSDFTANKRIVLPDFRGRVAVGLDNMGGTAANRMLLANGLDGTVLGQDGGTQTVTLDVTQIPAHTHATAVPATVATSADTGAAVGSPGADAPVTSSSIGGGLAHSNTQPSLIISKIIKL
ncbi:MAG: hypothetical protein WCL08_00130 [Verrucomicrobiota bacterium]